MLTKRDDRTKRLNSTTDQRLIGLSVELSGEQNDEIPLANVSSDTVRHREERKRERRSITLANSSFPLNARTHLHNQDFGGRAGERALLVLTQLGHLFNSILAAAAPSGLVNSAIMLERERERDPHSEKRRVGKYEVGRTIGEGTFAKVKFARNSETGEPVALKILDKEKVLKHKMAEQIKREIATMKLIKHPNVVQLYEVMGSKTKIFIVMEFVTGGELFDKIVNNGRMREDEARRYFQQLINAVDYCHSRCVYHRDLKPENLLLDAYGNLKVSDFGLSALSQQVRDDGLLHTTCGTPNYAAPEVLNDRGYDGATADLWSCGVILFVLLAGYLPFDDSNLINLYRKISAGEFTCPPWLSFGAMKLKARILDPNPMTRITICEILEDE
ncbi:hypothetical protein ACLB2K_026399 [Fragaria x ananassa]